MRKKLIITTILATIMGMASAQNTFKGQITDSKGVAIPYANIILLSLPDSSIVSGTISNLDGNFALPRQTEGNLIKVSSIGYNTVFLNADKEDIGHIALNYQDQEHGEIIIKEFVPKTTIKGSSMVSKVDGTLLQLSATVEEMLVQIPGVSKDKNGITIIGKGAPLIYINGRELRDNSEINELFPTNIKSVEVITNPGAKYDATVKSVIKITTKPYSGEKISCDAEIRHSQELQEGLAEPGAKLSANYRKNNLDFFGGADYSRIDYQDWSRTIQNTFSTKSYSQTNDATEFISGNDLNLNIGTNYQISENHSIGARYKFNKIFGNKQTDIISTSMKINNILEDELVDIIDADKRLAQNYRFNTYYNGSIADLSIDLNCDIYKADNDTREQSQENGTSGSQIVNNLSGTNQGIMATKLELSYPIWMGELSAGTELTSVNRKNNYETTLEKLGNSKSEVDEKLSSVFTQYSISPSEKITADIGLRYEHTNYSYEDIIASETIKRPDNQLFPSACITSQLGSVYMMLSYNQKTSRPQFDELNDATSYINRYTYQKGDSRLKNTLYHEIGLNMAWKMFTVMLSYEKSKNATTQWSELYDDNGIIMLKTINLESPHKLLTGVINISKDISFWSINWDVDIMKPWLKIKLEDSREPSGFRHKEYNKPIFLANLNNKFSVPTPKNNLYFELNYNMISKGNNLNWTLSEDYHNIEAAAIYQCWKTPITIRLSFNDILGREKQDCAMDCGYYQLEQIEKKYSKCLKISLHYTFNQPESKYKGTGSGDNAVERMQ